LNKEEIYPATNMSKPKWLKLEIEIEFCEKLKDCENCVSTTCFASKDIRGIFKQKRKNLACT